MKQFSNLAIVVLLAASFFILHSLFSPVYASPDNKVGINLAGIWSSGNFNDAADIVGDGGWVTVLTCTGDLLQPEIFDQNRNVNVILRLFNGGNKFLPEHAPAYVKMLGDLDTKGKKIYVMPWNEPNMDRESGGSRDPAAVAAWVRELHNELSAAGLLNNKVILLSPAFNQSTPDTASATNIETFVQQILAADSNFWSYFHGIAMNIYQFDGNPETHTQLGYKGYATLTDRLGAGGKPVYITEFGRVGAGGVYYDDSAMASILNEALDFYNGESRVKAVTPLAYDPEPSPHNFYLCGPSSCNSSSATAGAIMAHRQPGSATFGASQPGFDFWKTANCPSNACDFGTVGAPCGGGGERGCDNPRDGEKDTGCYGATLKKDSPDESSIDWLIRKVKTFFHWGGDGPIEVTNLTIPIEGDLDKLLGSESQEGTLPKLTPPGAPSEELRQNRTSYLEDYSRGILDVTSCEAPGSKDVEFAVPDVWGLKNTAVNLFSYLVKIPGTGPGPQGSLKENYQTNTAGVRDEDFEPTVRLAHTGSVLGDPPASGCYGPGLCDKIDAPDKPVCLTGDYGLIGSADDPTQPATEEGDICTIPDTETRTCTAYDVLGGLPPSPPCPAGPELPVCTVIGATFPCNENIPSCDNASENDLSMPPRISFLGGPEGYTDNIIETYKIFTIPGIGFKNDLFGEGKFDWNYQNVDRQDEKAMYRKLGTVQCLEDHVRQVLSLPGHGVVLKEECFDD